jgi:hypothetical protein
MFNNAQQQNPTVELGVMDREDIDSEQEAFQAPWPNAPQSVLSNEE